MMIDLSSFTPLCQYGALGIFAMAGLVYIFKERASKNKLITKLYELQDKRYNDAQAIHQENYKVISHLTEVVTEILKCVDRIELHLISRGK